MSVLSYAPPSRPANFQLLEINVINAQDLAQISRHMKTYAIAWVHPRRKLSTRVDSKNGNNPSWNDKFVFRVDESFLRTDTSSVMIEIYAVRWFKDIRVGSVNVLVGNLLPPASETQPLNSGMRCMALQVRRPSGRPQGIINIGVALLDGSLKSMPLYTQLSCSAVGYRDLMGEEPQTPNHPPIRPHEHNKANALRRCKSERPSNATDPDYPRKSEATESGDPPMITINTTSSMWSGTGSEIGPPPSMLPVGTQANDLFSLQDGGGGDEWHPEKNGKVEDLKSKLERWKTELPAKPVIERSMGSFRAKPKYGHKYGNNGHKRRNTDMGLFSCFGDLGGFECAVTCGVKPRKGGHIHDGLLSDSDSEPGS